METFTQRWQQLDWDDIGLRINSKTNVDVERALQTFRPDREDMLALLSPAAAHYLEPMARKAQQLTRQRFGNTVGFTSRSTFLICVLTTAPIAVFL